MSEINFINLLGSTCTVLHVYLLPWDLEIWHQGRGKVTNERFPQLLLREERWAEAALGGDISPR